MSYIRQTKECLLKLLLSYLLRPRITGLLTDSLLPSFINDTLTFSKFVVLSTPVYSSLYQGNNFLSCFFTSYEDFIRSFKYSSAVLLYFVFFVF